MTNKTMTMMTLRRCIKGQNEKILKLDNWQELIKDVIIHIADEVYNNTPPEDVPKIFNFRNRNKIKIITLDDRFTNTKSFNVFRSQIDSRLVNNRTIIVFMYDDVLKLITFNTTKSRGDITKSKDSYKIMISETSDYLVSNSDIFIKGLQSPYICFSADQKGNIFPSEYWRGVGIVDEVKINNYRRRN